MTCVAPGPVTLVAPGLYLRHLEVPDVLARIHARYAEHVAAHNAEVTATSAQRSSLRDEVLQLFTPAARRLAR